MLRLLGVPSFLLLPGVLFLLTYRWLWTSQVLGAKNEADRFSVEVTKPEFWLLAITLSGIMAFVYPSVTKHSYLESYNLADMARVWLLSVGFAFVTWLILFVAIRKYRASVEKGTLPSINDDEFTVLKKLAKQKLGLRLPKVSYTDKEGNKLAAWLLQPKGRDGDIVWVGPPMVAKCLPGADQGTFKQIKDKWNLNAFEEVHQLLIRDDTVNGVELKWKKGTLFPKTPVPLKPSECKDYTIGDVDQFVEFE